MNHHPAFRRLAPHSDEELAARLGSEVAERAEVHARPLSRAARG